ncbi:MAG: radical SAM protein [Patescibacteria group bacterium]|jgi:radical SAM superfamily enzyme YgiQ (UPF0313 family)
MPKVLFAMRDDGDMTEPMNIMLLSALAKRHGWTTDLVVLERDDIVDVVRRKGPDVVAFSAITGSHQELLKANTAIKNAVPSIKTVIGGPFATFSPQTIRTHPFDAVGVGECDDAWPELLRGWENNRSVDNIHNIVTKENAERVLKKTLDKQWLIKPEHLRARKVALDDLPFMDRDLIYENTGFAKRFKRTMMASRGCPKRCTYCFEHAWNGMYVGKGPILTRHSVERLCAELRELKERWDTRFIKFYDDVFPVFPNTDDEWLEEFAEVYPREVGLPFHCLVRAELVNEPDGRKLKLLKKAGIASLTMSIESGNAFARDFVLIRDMTNEDMRNSFKIARELKIHTFANTILAIPSPTLPDIHASQEEYDAQLGKIISVASEVDPHRKMKVKKLSERVQEAKTLTDDEAQRRIDIQGILLDAGVRAEPIDYDKESIWYNVDLNVSFGEFPILFPYAGTQLGEYAVRHNYFDGNYDKLHASYQTVSPLDCFTEKEKLQQQNLALLGTIVLFFAGSFHPVLNKLAKPVTRFAVDVLADLPLTSVYVRVYSVAKNYMHSSRMYPMKYSLRERAHYLWENLVLDTFKQLKKPTSHEPAWRKIFKNRNDRPGQTLGGPPSI